jgi:hypothetical protein
VSEQACGRGGWTRASPREGWTACGRDGWTRAAREKGGRPGAGTPAAGDKNGDVWVGLLGEVDFIGVLAAVEAAARRLRRCPLRGSPDCRCDSPTVRAGYGSQAGETESPVVSRCRFKSKSSAFS